MTEKGLISRLYFIWRLFHGQRGTGLAETIVAVGIVGIALTTFITSLSVGSRAVGELDQEQISQHLAQSQMETTKAAPYDATGASYTTIAGPVGYSISLNVNSGIYADNNIQLITVTINRDALPVFVMEDYKVNR